MLQNLFWTWPVGAPPPCSREGGRAAGEAGAWLPPASPLAAAGRLCSAGAEAPAAVSRVSPLVCGLPAPGSPLHPPRSRLGPGRPGKPPPVRLGQTLPSVFSVLVVWCSLRTVRVPQDSLLWGIPHAVQMHWQRNSCPGTQVHLLTHCYAYYHIHILAHTHSHGLTLTNKHTHEHRHKLTDTHAATQSHTFDCRCTYISELLFNPQSHRHNPSCTHTFTTVFIHTHTQTQAYTPPRGILPPSPQPQPCCDTPRSPVGTYHYHCTHHYGPTAGRLWGHSRQQQFMATPQPHAQPCPVTSLPAPPLCRPALPAGRGQVSPLPVPASLRDF